MPLPYEMNKSKEKVAMPERNSEKRSKTFDEVSYGYTPEQAMEEARRCIQCKHTPCIFGCPVQVPIPSFIAQLAQGNIAAAYSIIKSANALPAVCGRVCPQESQCEGVCTRGRNGEPVAIGRLERFVADWALAHPEEQLKEDQQQEGNPLKGMRVACIGSGPASLTCGGELAKRGAEVTIYEAFHKVGGVLVYGIPEFRLPKELVEREVDALRELGVHFEVDTVIGRLLTIDELLEDHGFDAVFVGTGAGLPSYLGIEGEGLNGVMVANELLTRVNLMKAYLFPQYETPVYVGKRCVVVGGGNVAMDAARTARRLGSEVSIVYRRSLDEMPARAEEIHHAKQEGITFSLLTNPTKVLGDEEGWVAGLECVQMELGEPEEDGRRRVSPITGSEFVLDIDMLVIAVGSKTNPLIAKTTPGLEVSRRNLVIADEETGATSRPGVFAGGDSVIGAATVILAMGAGKRAARGIETYLLAKRKGVCSTQGAGKGDDKPREALKDKQTLRHADKTSPAG